ncbi:hypothetical protein LO763_27850 [Glycomyces sp. A-F 0318]|uniref:hypothetical protein n=1 Tax=Glycomyces amatae TaxID=2881355 RepID=UPI001E5F9B6C|nr:hypothetical protein [Glycomyces amatae]MCD0447435.1 hypothetical protein [Glycomyces amatae]
MLGLLAVIVTAAGARRPCPGSVPRRLVERAIGRLKRYRAVSTRFGELAVRYEATVRVAIILDRRPSS